MWKGWCWSSSCRVLGSPAVTPFRPAKNSQLEGSTAGQDSQTHACAWNQNSGTAFEWSGAWLNQQLVPPYLEKTGLDKSIIEVHILEGGSQLDSRRSLVPWLCFGIEANKLLPGMSLQLRQKLNWNRNQLVPPMSRFHSFTVH